MADEPQDPNELSPDETIAGVNLPPPPGSTPPPPGAPPPPSHEHLPPPPDQPTPPPASAPPPPDQPTPPPGVPATPPPAQGYVAPPPPAKKGGAKWGFAVLGVLVLVAAGLGAFLIFGGDDGGGGKPPPTSDGTDVTVDDGGDGGDNGNTADAPPIAGDIAADPLTTVTGLNESGSDISVNNIAVDPAGGFITVGSRSNIDTGDVEQTVWHSDDGETWEELETTGLESGPADEVPSMSAVVSDGDQFVAVGSLIDSSDDQLPVAWTSPDGEAWEEADVSDIDDFGVQEQMIGVGVDPAGGFIAVGSLFTETGDEDAPFEEDPGVWRSDDGTSWEQVQTSGLEDPDTGDFLAAVVATEDGGFIGVGSGFLLDGPSRDPLIWSSDDGESWDLVDTSGIGDDDRNEFPLAITNAADGGFIAVGNTFDVGGSNRDPLVLVSEDGSDWEVAEDRLFTASLDEILNGVVPDGDGFLASGVTVEAPIEGTMWRLQFG